MTEINERDVERMKEIVASLSPEDQEIYGRLQQISHGNALRAAAAGIMARNFSHGLGRHVMFAHDDLYQANN